MKTFTIILLSVLLMGALSASAQPTTGNGVNSNKKTTGKKATANKAQQGNTPVAGLLLNAAVNVRVSDTTQTPTTNTDVVVSTVGTTAGNLQNAASYIPGTGKIQNAAGTVQTVTNTAQKVLSIGKGLFHKKKKDQDQQPQQVVSQ